jgi:hypothetical protein
MKLCHEPDPIQSPESDPARGRFVAAVLTRSQVRRRGADRVRTLTACLVGKGKVGRTLQPGSAC